MSDHFINFIFLPVTKPKSNTEKVKYRAYTTANIGRLSDELNEHNFENVYSSDNINDAYNKFTDAFTDLLNKTIPIKEESSIEITTK